MLYRSHYDFPFVIVPFSAVRSALDGGRLLPNELLRGDISIPRLESNIRAAERILDAHEKAIENLFAFIERAANSGR